jgi:putative membrane-bound dehydrogenase-like protein
MGMISERVLGPGGGFLLALYRSISCYSILASLGLIASPLVTLAAEFRAGAAAVDVSPVTLPAIQNGGFLEASADRVVDPLFARALVLDDGASRIAIVVVDSCMLPRPVCDEAKRIASDATGIARDRILIAATHTHSAPSAMDYCLGSRADPDYTASLPPRVAQAIIAAAKRLSPAEIGVTVADAPEHSNCRRWIRRPDRIDVDPFGERTVRAMMHPGYQNPDYIGPAGPVDSGLSLLSVRALDGRPIALLGNYSMHYFGMGGGFSADYFGRFARGIEARIAPGESGDDRFVGILSQGTSGDLHWMDYSHPHRAVGIDEFASGLVDIALEAYRTIRYSSSVPLSMLERRITLNRRRPDAARLEWARRTLPDRTRRPRNQPEVYAEQAFFIDENSTEEIVLQALRIGEIGIAAIPCEVFGITGLELKARSPLQPTFNMELANGASGYIPPPAQHALGGYTTWPARTAGLEVDAEPKIVAALLEMLETVSGDARREPPLLHGAYAATVLAARPAAYWRFEEFRGPELFDASGQGRRLSVTPGVAFHLEGPSSSAFSIDRENRALHFAGGRAVSSDLSIGPEYSIELWFWNGLASEAREVLGTLCRVGGDELRIVRAADRESGVLEVLGRRGTTPIPARSWCHVAMARATDSLSVFLGGRLEIEARIEPVDRTEERQLDARPRLVIGGDDPATGFEGKIDEVALFDRCSSPSEIAEHFRVASVAVPRAPPRAAGYESRPSTPGDLDRHAEVLRAARPIAYWPLHRSADGAPAVGMADDASGNGLVARLESGASLRVPGTADANFTGGRLQVTLASLGDQYSVELWFANDLPNDARPVTGYFLSIGADGAEGAPGEHLGIGGTHVSSGRLIVFNGNARDQVLSGRTTIGRGTWNHVVLVRDGARVRVHLNGELEPDASGELDRTYPRRGELGLFVGGRNDGFAPFQGRIDQVAIYDRPLSPDEIARNFRASGLEPRIESSLGPALESRPPSLVSDPRSPAETLRATRVRDGFRLELVAAEPLVVDPVAIDFGADGRLWVVEMADYPLGIDGKGQAGGRVRWLEDLDGDGYFESSTLFAEGLSFPTGVLAWKRGVLVTAAPDILYLPDEDADGRADGRDVLYTGFLPGNQQLRINGLRYGLDNWIYCANGGHHAGYGADRRVTSIETGTPIALGSRDFRIRPEQGLLEPQSGPSQFGRVRDDEGNWFGVQNSRPLWHFVLDDPYSRRDRYLPAPDPRHLLRGENPELWPAKTPEQRYHSFEHATRFTSACGPSIYRDDLLFPRDGITHAFTCDPFHGIVQHLLLERDGVTFSASVDTRAGEQDFFASADGWCRPVMTRTGPDGALWVVDMYRYMIEHPEWLPPSGRDELLPHYRSGDDRGRIYRIVPAGGARRESPAIARESATRLIERLGGSNGTLRDLAQRGLIESRGETRETIVVPALERMLRADPRSLARLHALATLDGMGALSSAALRVALADTAAPVVRHALRLAEAHGQSSEIVRAALSHVAHGDRAVVLELAQRIGAWNDPAAGVALGRIAVMYHDDRWIRSAVLGAASSHQEALATAIAAHGDVPLREFAPPLYTLALATQRFDVAATLLAPIVADERPRGLAAWQLEALSGMLDALGEAGTSMAQLARDGAIAPELVDRVSRAVVGARRSAFSDESPEDVRRASVSLIGREPGARDEDRVSLERLLGSTIASDSVKFAALDRLRGMYADAGPVIAAWPTFLPELRTRAITVLLSSDAWTRALLDALDAGEIPLASIGAVQRQRLTTHESGEVAALASALRKRHADRSHGARRGAPARDEAERRRGTRARDLRRALLELSRARRFRRRDRAGSPPVDGPLGRGAHRRDRRSRSGGRTALRRPFRGLGHRRSSARADHGRDLEQCDLPTAPR